MDAGLCWLSRRSLSSALGGLGPCGFVKFDRRLHVSVSGLTVEESKLPGAGFRPRQPRLEAEQRNCVLFLF